MQATPPLLGVSFKRDALCQHRYRGFGATSFFFLIEILNLCGGDGRCEAGGSARRHIQGLLFASNAVESP